ncbi:MAG: hypothetical protein ACRDZO_05180 [Egibacteraceae bacterium]
MISVASYIAARIRTDPPDGLHVVPGSTPVVAFGDLERADIATLGINPSSQEFLDSSGHLLSGDRRRLATMESLRAQRLVDLTDEQTAQVYEDCAVYFHRNPYRRFFDKLDEILQKGLARSYYSGSACHLDLVQWATHPVWSGLDGRVRRQLLEADSGFLGAQLQREGIQLLVLNGKSVIDRVKALNLVDLDVVGSTPLGHEGRRVSSLVRGEAVGGVAVVGWTLNVPDRACTAGNRQRLVEWLRTLDLLGPRYLPQAVVRSKRDLYSLLSEWLASSSAQTIGGPGYGQRAHVWIELAGSRVRLNADTTRAAAERYVTHAQANGVDAPWTVIPNRSGRVNRVSFDGAATPGWYAYLTTENDGLMQL